MAFSKSQKVGFFSHKNNNWWSYNKIEDYSLMGGGAFCGAYGALIGLSLGPIGAIIGGLIGAIAGYCLHRLSRSIRSCMSSDNNDQEDINPTNPTNTNTLTA